MSERRYLRISRDSVRTGISCEIMIERPILLHDHDDDDVLDEIIGGRSQRPDLWGWLVRGDVLSGR